jgi:hypothetical protein
MTSPHPRLVLQVFERLCGDKQFWEKLQPPGTVFCRHRIYTLAVVVRLMLVQRLLEGGSLSQAVQRFVQARVVLVQAQAPSHCVRGPIAGLGKNCPP